MNQLEVIHAHRFAFVRRRGGRELSSMRIEADRAWAAGRVHRGRLLDFEVAMSVLLAKRTVAAQLAVASVNKVSREFYRAEMWYWQWRLWLMWVGGRELKWPLLENKHG